MAIQRITYDQLGKQLQKLSRTPNYLPKKISDSLKKAGYSRYRFNKRPANQKAVEEVFTHLKEKGMVRTPKTSRQLYRILAKDVRAQSMVGKDPSGYAPISHLPERLSRNELYSFGQKIVGTQKYEPALDRALRELGKSTQEFYSQGDLKKIIRKVHVYTGGLPSTFDSSLNKRKKIIEVFKKINREEENEESRGKSLIPQQPDILDGRYESREKASSIYGRATRSTTASRFSRQSAKVLNTPVSSASALQRGGLEEDNQPVSSVSRLQNSEKKVTDNDEEDGVKSKEKAPERLSDIISE